MATTCTLKFAGQCNGKVHWVSCFSWAYNSGVVTLKSVFRLDSSRLALFKISALQIPSRNNVSHRMYFNTLAAQYINLSFGLSEFKEPCYKSVPVGVYAVRLCLRVKISKRHTNYGFVFLNPRTWSPIFYNLIFEKVIHLVCYSNNSLQ